MQDCCHLCARLPAYHYLYQSLGKYKIGMLCTYCHANRQYLVIEMGWKQITKEQYENYQILK